MVNAVLAAVVGISLYTDIKHRKIYNSAVGIGKDLKTHVQKLFVFPFQ